MYWLLAPWRLAFAHLCPPPSSLALARHAWLLPVRLRAVPSFGLGGAADASDTAAFANYDVTDVRLIKASHWRAALETRAHDASLKTGDTHPQYQAAGANRGDQI